MKLSELQSKFKDAMGPVQDPDVLRNFKSTGNLNLNEAFEVYHEGYTKRLSTALEETYEAVRWILGDNLFEAACRRYIESQPSVSYNLAEYGHSFPDFLRDTQLTKGIPFLHDLARFEWLIKVIYHSATPDPLPVERARELMNEDDFRVNFIDAMALFQSPFSIHELWHNRHEPQYQFEAINWARPENLLIFKKDKRIHVKRIDTVEFQILSELRDGLPISMALATYSTIMNPERIDQLFQMMLKAGIIDDVTPL